MRLNQTDNHTVSNLYRSVRQEDAMSVHTNIHDVCEIKQSEHYYPKCEAGPFYETRFEFYNSNGECICTIGAMGEFNSTKIIFTKVK